MKTPLQAFLHWFDGLPVPNRQCLAHLFRMLIAETVDAFMVEPDHSLKEFRLWLLKSDFPLRVAARVFQVRCVFDMILENRKVLISGAHDYLGGEVIELSMLQWDQTYTTWKELRCRGMSDFYMHAWACSVAKLEMEAC